MRTLLRAGAIALTASATLLGGAVAAQAATTDTVTVKANRLIFEPGKYGHTGSLRIAVRNTSSEPFSGSIAITEPVPGTTGTLEGVSGCGLNSTPDGRDISFCYFDDAIAPGRTRVVTVAFRSPAAPQPYAQVAPLLGSVVVGGVTAEFPALFRSTTGSLRRPRPYMQDTTTALTVTAGDVTLARQQDGTFAGRAPVTVRNNSDAPHRELWAEIAVPAGIDGWPGIRPSEICVNTGKLPVPPDGNGLGCLVYGGQLAEGEERSFEWLLTAPAGTPAGPLGTATTMAWTVGPDSRQSDGANVVTFDITVAD